MRWLHKSLGLVEGEIVALSDHGKWVDILLSRDVQTAFRIDGGRDRFDREGMVVTYRVVDLSEVGR